MPLTNLAGKKEFMKLKPKVRRSHCCL